MLLNNSEAYQFKFRLTVVFIWPSSFLLISEMTYTVPGGTLNPALSVISVIISFSFLYINGC